MHNRIVFMVFGCGPFSGKMAMLVFQGFDPFSGKMVVWAIIWDNGEAWFLRICFYWAKWVFGVRGKNVVLRGMCIGFSCIHVV